MQQESPRPIGPFDLIVIGWNLLLTLFAAHDYAATCYLHRRHGRKVASLGVKLIAVSLPMIHAFGWAVWIQYHPQVDPAFGDFRVLMLAHYPTLGLVAYRTIMGWFNTRDHRYYGGDSYLHWVFGGSEIGWQRVEWLSLVVASPFCARWGYPFAGLILAMGVSMAAMEVSYHAGRRRVAGSLRDAEIEGRLMMR